MPPVTPTYGLLEGTVLNMMKWASNSLNALPDAPLSGLNEVAGALNWVLSLVSGASILIPVNTIFTILGLVMALKVFKVGLFGVNWLIRRVADFIP